MEIRRFLKAVLKYTVHNFNKRAREKVWTEDVRVLIYDAICRLYSEQLMIYKQFIKDEYILALLQKVFQSNF